MILNVFFKRISTEIFDLSGDSHHFTYRYFSSLCPGLLFHTVQCHHTSTNWLQNPPHLYFPLNFIVYDPFLSIWNLWYLLYHSGIIRKRNKFVVFYAVTMGLYMVSFLTLGIGTAVTPQFITSQCDSDTPSDYQTTF